MITIESEVDLESAVNDGINIFIRDVLVPMKIVDWKCYAKVPNSARYDVCKKVARMWSKTSAEEQTISEHVKTLESAALSLLVPLRMGEGLDPAKLQQVLLAIESLTARVFGLETIPKRAVSVLIDASIAIEGCTGLYPQSDAKRLFDAAERIREKFRDLLNGPTGPAPIPLP